MPYCVSEADTDCAFADCRLEMQYGHQQEVEMIPLMMTKGYRATGWLGML